MPELPEVEFNRRRLARWLGRGDIVSCVVDDPRICAPQSPRDFAEGTRRKRIDGVDRRGKWLRIRLSGGGRIFVHLGMSGWFEHATTDTPLRFERARITVKKKTKTEAAVYTDPRRWGRWVFAEEDIPSWTKLAGDPIHDDIDPAVIVTKLQKRKTQTIKEAMLDQKILAGVGNIQAAEALWRAKMDPRSPARALDAKDVKRLLTGIAWTIERTTKSLEENEAMVSPFVVYGRAGEPCKRCKTVLTKIELGGRTTTFCTGCQEKLRAKPMSSRR
ncbi:MAG TPA: DNA-formamidopyrimidine glycosylase family protein [Polyangiaceae bacterium]